MDEGRQSAGVGVNKQHPVVVWKSPTGEEKKEDLHSPSGAPRNRSDPSPLEPGNEESRLLETHAPTTVTRKEKTRRTLFVVREGRNFQ